ncbi:hypothetical protein, partial [Klebsiella pneumoniae]|uniref:hypothetical protein n=1 Tax=Klebsiella pneumoniae TaxID=573 RepID=UPI0022B5FB7F
MQKPKKKPLVVKKRSWHPAVMANLMRQAQEEDYRREQMAELERSARSHFADIGGGWRLSVPVFRYPGDRWEYQQLLERCNGRATGGVDAGNLSRYARARRSRLTANPSSG